MLLFRQFSLAVKVRWREHCFIITKWQWAQVHFVGSYTIDQYFNDCSIVGQLMYQHMGVFLVNSLTLVRDNHFEWNKYYFIQKFGKRKERGLRKPVPNHFDYFFYRVLLEFYVLLSVVSSVLKTTHTSEDDLRDNQGWMNRMSKFWGLSIRDVSEMEIAHTEVGECFLVNINLKLFLNG